MRRRPVGPWSEPVRARLCEFGCAAGGKQRIHARRLHDVHCVQDVPRDDALGEGEEAVCEQDGHGAPGPEVVRLRKDAAKGDGEVL